MDDAAAAAAAVEALSIQFCTPVQAAPEVSRAGDGQAWLVSSALHRLLACSINIVCSALPCHALPRPLSGHHFVPGPIVADGWRKPSCLIKGLPWARCLQAKLNCLRIPRGCT